MNKETMGRIFKDAVLTPVFRTALEGEKLLGRLTGGTHANGYFMQYLDITPVETHVKIVREDEQSVTLAKYNSDGSISDSDFVLMCTTDFHLESEKPFENVKTLQMMLNHARDVKPDLIIFTGDIVQTENQNIDCIQFAKLMEKLGIYWVYVFGNHEAREEKEYHKQFMLKNLSRYKHCLSREGDPSLYGYGNFAVHIMNSANSLSQSLYFFDSGRDITDEYRKEYSLPEDMKGYDFLKSNQIEWYKKQITLTNRHYGETKSMMFMHIALPEYENIMAPGEDGLYHDTGKSVIKYGVMYESVGCSPYNSGMFSAIKELGSTQAVFAGHDHLNDFCALYDGVYLVYVQPGGYAAYTMQVRGFEEKDWLNGVTAVKINGSGGIDISQRKNSVYING